MKLVSSRIRQGHAMSDRYAVRGDIARNRIFKAISGAGRLREVGRVVDPIRNDILPRALYHHPFFTVGRGPGRLEQEGVFRLRLRYLRYTVSKWWSGA